MSNLIHLDPAIDPILNFILILLFSSTIIAGASRSPSKCNNAMLSKA